jgi:integrase
MKPSRRVAELTAAAESESSRRSYAADLRHFAERGGSIPATPEAVAEYLATHAGILAVATLEHRLVAICKAHQELGIPTPTKNVLVKRTMQGIRRTQGTAQRRMHALVRDDLVDLLGTVGKQRQMKAARDKALLLIGFAGAFRRSELVALNTDDITGFPHGIELLIRRSKTDQEGAGRTVFIPQARSAERCPVRALTDWLQVAGISGGPIFRAVNRHDQISHRRLSAQAVALIVKASVAAARGPDSAMHFGGHSLRAGFVTEAAMVGLPTSAIMGQTGHRSLEMVYRYIRPVEKRKLPTLL